jgi:GT2 family glycosyltransferase
MQPVNIDIIILSYARDEPLKNLTIQTISTLFDSEDPEKVRFNVLVIESNKSLQPYQYENSATIYPTEKFGFHKYLNIGIKTTTNPYICLCNNDLVFHKGWATEILKAMDNDKELLSAAPCLPGYSFNKEVLTGDESKLDGYFGVLFGWCIFVKREIFDTIGMLDENFAFWYADYDYAYTLKRHNLKNSLIPSSIVNHLGSGSWNTMNRAEHDKLTQMPRIYFSYKWHHHSYTRYKLETLFFKIKSLLRPN